MILHHMIWYAQFLSTPSYLPYAHPLCHSLSLTLSIGLHYLTNSINSTSPFVSLSFFKSMCCVKLPGPSSFQCSIDQAWSLYREKRKLKDHEENEKKSSGMRRRAVEWEEEQWNEKKSSGMRRREKEWGDKK